MQHKRYLIFDLDNTIFDFSRGEQEGLSKILKHYPIKDLTFEQWLTAFKKVNSEIWKQIESGGSAKELLNTRFSRTYQEFEIEIDGKKLESEYRGYLDESYFMLAGAKELLENLKKQGYKIIAGTNGNSSTQRSRLKGTGLDSVFHDVIISDEIGYAKPNKKFFDVLMDGHKDMTPENSLMIGDSLRSDIQGAINAGITNIWFNLFGVENRTGIVPDYEALSIKEIENLITLKVNEPVENH